MTKISGVKIEEKQIYLLSESQDNESVWVTAKKFSLDIINEYFNKTYAEISQIIKNMNSDISEGIKGDDTDILTDKLTIQDEYEQLANDEVDILGKRDESGRMTLKIKQEQPYTVSSQNIDEEKEFCIESVNSDEEEFLENLSDDFRSFRNRKNVLKNNQTEQSSICNTDTSENISDFNNIKTPFLFGHLSGDSVMSDLTKYGSTNQSTTLSNKEPSIEKTNNYNFNKKKVKTSNSKNSEKVKKVKITSSKENKDIQIYKKNEDSEIDIYDNFIFTRKKNVRNIKFYTGVWFNPNENRKRISLKFVKIPNKKSILRANQTLFQTGKVKKQIDDSNDIFISRQGKRIDGLSLLGLLEESEEE
ncbi:hypothetical protein CWI37_0723p0020 [Hamiltosporidium tvaerminnensis]|uniref:Uncharacterized protein n=1 Tax=Hamiltosporidium tvaerminnensis TaxID=1176355 RepID=A0A4Q9L3K6_9MICR|nr:hypothetical protein CWI37_0723p0020 [Hamiltosporidium tvaerminnensis]